MKSLQRELQSGELEAKLEQQRQVQHVQQETRLVRSDDGSSFIQATNRREEPQCMPTVPYWKNDQRADTVTNTAPRSGSGWWATTQRVINELRRRDEAAMAELKRVGAV